VARNYWSRFLDQRLARRRALAIAGGTALGGALLAACGGSDDDSDGGGDKSGLVAKPVDSSKQAKRGGTLKVSTNRDVIHLDVAVAQAPLETAQWHTYSRLTQPKPEYMQEWRGEFGPDLAESWETSPDGLQVTFRLRPDIKFHNKPPVNGRAFDSSDAVFSWDRFVRVGGDRASISNAVNPNAPVVSVTATDARTVVVKMKYPLAYVPAIFGQHLTGHITMLPKETDTTFDPKRDMIGTGPFMLTGYEPSVGYKFARHTEYYDKERPYIDTVELPILVEYAQGLAQFRAGNLYTYTVRAEDILAAKRDTPDLNLYEDSIYWFHASFKTNFGWAGKSPYLDERVRQAMSMSYDRDLWIDTFYNTGAFESAGLPVERRWNTHLSAQFPGWWADPRDKSFGANSKYFEHNIEEAKRLLAAAGYPNGLDTVISFAATGFGPDHPRQVEVLNEMAREAGFRIASNPIANYVGEYIPRYRDAKGNHEGLTSKLGAVYAEDPVAYLSFEYYSKGGDNFFGFDAAGKGDNSGDPTVDALIEKARAEFDAEKRKSLVLELQRHLAKSMYAIRFPGGGSTYLLAWPVMQNLRVYVGDERRPNFYTWLDETKAPIRRA
jgi:peptide/nickel transport system substrate-binding protein